MNKRAIWSIIGLMSAALIGIILLQINLIRSAAELKKDQFEQNVFDALNDVATQLEKDEEFQESFHKNGYSLRKNESLRQGLSLITSMPEIPFSSLGILKDREAVNAIWEKNQRARNRPLTKRIDIQQLDEYIRRELADHNIRTPHHYGVFSTEEAKNCFIIEDGHYVVEETEPKYFLPGQKSLYNSDYKVHLFSTGISSPGMLMVFFLESQILYGVNFG
ncbi:MAG: hypothetical protein HC912_02505 [Saprospiraceae bacterium]|nr:hypothetical protein [Saprospiraceae bacterium]